MSFFESYVEALLEWSASVVKPRLGGINMQAIMITGPASIRNI